MKEFALDTARGKLQLFCDATIHIQYEHDTKLTRLDNVIRVQSIFRNVFLIASGAHFIRQPRGEPEFFFC